MAITLTSNYKEIYDTIVTDQIDEWVEDGTYELRDMLDYLDTYGQDKFSYFEEYMTELDDIYADDAREALDEYLDDVGGPECVQGAAEAYCGQWTTLQTSQKKKQSHAAMIFHTGSTLIGNLHGKISHGII